MSPKKRKSDIETTGGRRVTRQQARLNISPTPQTCRHVPGGSFVSPFCSRKNANTFPRAAQRIRGREVNGEQENSVILSDDPSPQSDSDKDIHHLSDTSDFEAELRTYARRAANIGSKSWVGITRNVLGHTGVARSNVGGGVRARNSSIDDVRLDLDVPFSAFIRGDVRANVPRNGAGVGNGTMSRDEPTSPSYDPVERVVKNTSNLPRTCSFGLTELIGMFVSESGMEEVQSPAVGTVHGYIVKQEFVSTLKRIIDKHGDIAANYQMKSSENRSAALETICQMIQIFQRKRFNEIPLSEITSWSSRVSDFGKTGMAVEWLEKRLEQMEEAKRMIKESSSLKEEKNKYSELVKELNTKLEDHRTQLRDCKTQSVILNELIQEHNRQLEFFNARAQELQVSEKSTMEDLEIAQENVRRLNQITSVGIRNVKFFLEHPLVDDLL